MSLRILTNSSGESPFVTDRFGHAHRRRFQAVRSKAELPDTADGGRLDTFFSAVGRFIISWGNLEQGLDIVIRAVHAGKIVPPTQPQLPQALERKIRYFRETNAAHVQDPRLARMLDDLSGDLTKRAPFRHKIVHGFLQSVDPDGFWAEFGRFHRTKINAPLEIYRIELEEISYETLEVQDLAGQMFLLAKDIQRFRRD